VLDEEKNKKIQLQKSDQNNTQDMDQKQNVDVKPSQVYTTTALLIFLL
jgi:hypothetical protein